MGETVNFGDAGGLIFGYVEEDAHLIVADKTNALKVGILVWIGGVG